MEIFPPTSIEIFKLCYNNHITKKIHGLTEGLGEIQETKWTEVGNLDYKTMCVEFFVLDY